jgi:predicted phage-related endonuclease
MSIMEMESKAHELKELERMQEELAAEIEALKDAIKAAMGDQEAITAGAYKITWKPVTTNRLDGKAVRTALPDVYNRFTVTNTARRFCIN